MLINFDEMETQALEHFKGGDGTFFVKMFSNDLGKIMYGKLEPGSSIGWHIHETSSEVIYMTKGTGTVLLENGTETVPTGCATYCPKGQGHSLRNESDSDIEYLAIVSEQ